jgi:hypothetical protein
MLADVGGCTRDIPYFQKLGLNSITVLHIDTGASHLDCMRKLQDAGIYAMVQLNGRERKGPFSVNDSWIRTWDYDYFSHFEEIIDEFQRYPNTLGFYLYVDSGSGGPLGHLKAAVQFMKERIRTRKYRAIPVGISNSVYTYRTFYAINAFLTTKPDSGCQNQKLIRLHELRRSEYFNRYTDVRPDLEIRRVLHHRTIPPSRRHHRRLCQLLSPSRDDLRL